MDAFRVDARQARRAFQRAAQRGGDAGALQSEVERRMLERLDYVRLLPGRVLDAGCGAGRGLGLLRRRYPRAQLLGVDFARAAIRAASRSESLAERVRRFFRGVSSAHVCADFARLPLAAGAVDMVWSNLALPWAEDPVAALREFQRVLAPGGLLMFSSYGPDTLKELRSAFAATSAARRVHPFTDMHDVGDMLVACGFAAPVMDVETFTLTYSRVENLARDLRASGQTCAALDRPRALTGRGTWRKMLAAYEEGRESGRLRATVEVVYGHAWKVEPLAREDGRQVVKWAEKIPR
ncbi:MAG TPA: methyltransferase domain-containing protein [Burkholderiales bacterium]|nr:methyltransferase domain-containing protein [Burkholderiales bacterium]